MNGAKVFRREPAITFTNPSMARIWWRGRSEERRVGKECRSRCDWSSDVCSSDLMLTVRRQPDEWRQGFSAGASDYVYKPLNGQDLVEREIGRASCRERV